MKILDLVKLIELVGGWSSIKKQLRHVFGVIISVHFYLITF